MGGKRQQGNELQPPRGVSIRQWETGSRNSDYLQLSRSTVPRDVETGAHQGESKICRAVAGRDH